MCRFNRNLFYFGLRANQDKYLNQENYSIHEICPVTGKPVFEVCNQVRLEPACAVTGSNAEISRLCWLVCWPVLLLVSSNKLRCTNDLRMQQMCVWAEKQKCLAFQVINAWTQEMHSFSTKRKLMRLNIKDSTNKI